jgi:serine/threonine protein phosphatase PrpC
MAKKAAVRIGPITAVLSAAGSRKENQDALDYLLLEDLGCWVLADGLGGHSGGAKAAEAVVKTIVESFRQAPGCSPDRVRDYFAQAQAAVRALQRTEPRWSEMASTAVVLASDFASVCWGHVGDSRLYWFRGGHLEYQTLDHSVPQALCSAGDIGAAQIRFHEDRNRLLRSLGRNDTVQAAVHQPPVSLDSGDAFLLCTDGFWEYVTEDEMQFDLKSSSTPQIWLRQMESRIEKAASGEHDNYSALAIYFA